MSHHRSVSTVVTSVTMDGVTETRTVTTVEEDGRTRTEEHVERTRHGGGRGGMSQHVVVRQESRSWS